MVTGEGAAPVRRSDDAESRLVAEAKPGAVGRIRHCGESACDVRFDGAEGWVQRSRLWGLVTGEKF